MIGKLLNFVVGKEPVAVSAAVTAVVGLAVAFGLDLTGEQTAAITAAVVAVLGLLGRSAVTPVRKTP